MKRFPIILVIGLMVIAAGIVSVYTSIYPPLPFTAHASFLHTQQIINLLIETN